MHRLIDASQFSAAQANPDLERILPELIDRLIRSTVGVGNFRDMRIPHGENYKVHGLDGYVSLREECRDIPAGKIAIEIGATASPTELARKAENEFSRVAKRLGKDVSDYIFVMIGRAAWDGVVKKKDSTGKVVDSYLWVDRKRAMRNKKKLTFKDTILIDQEALIGWINDDLETAIWFLEELGHTARLTGRGVIDLSTRIENYLARFRLTVAADILTDQQPDLTRLESDLAQPNVHPIVVYGNSDKEAAVAVCHMLANSKNLEDAPRVCVSTRTGVDLLAGCATPHIAVLEGEATLYANQLPKHKLVLAKALLSDPTQNPSMHLRRPSVETFAKHLKSDGELGDSETIARAMGRTMTALERNYGIHTENRAPWADPSNDNYELLIMLSVIGAWNTAKVWDREAETHRLQFKDIELIQQLTGEKDYDRISGIVKTYGREAGRSFGACDPMFAHAESVVALNAPIDAFYRFAHRFEDRHYDLLEKGLKTIFESRTQKNRPREEIYDPAKETGYSDDLLGGLILTFVLIGLFGDEPPLNLAPKQTTCRRFCDEIYSRRLPQLHDHPLLSGTISSWLPLLAEGCPHAFMTSLENLLEGYESAIKEIFRVRKHSYGFGDYHVGGSILWALERLAWIEEYLPRVANILLGLHRAAGSIDPRIGNQPLASLRRILSLYIPQSSASTATRLQTYKALVLSHGLGALDIFEILLDPRGGGAVTSTSKPIFTWIETSDRFWAEIYDERDALMEISIELVGESPSGLARLVDSVPLMEPELFTKFVDCLKALKPDSAGVLALLDELREFTARHAEFPDADWSVSADIVETLKNTMGIIKPQSIMRHLWLFENSWVRLPDISGIESYDALSLRRLKVMPDLVEAVDNGFFDFLKRVGAPYVLGETLARYLRDVENVISHIGVAALDHDDEKARPFIIGLSAGMSREMPKEWLGFLNITDLNLPKQCKHWIGEGLLPSSFTLTEAVSGSYPSAIMEGFWKNLNIYMLHRQEIPVGVIDALLDAGRAHDLAALANKSDAPLKDVDIKRIAESYLPHLASSLANGGVRDQMSMYYFWGLLETVETRGILSLEEIAKIEFPMAKTFQFNGPDGLTALHRILAQRPEEYVELLSYVFRADINQTGISDNAVAELKEPSKGVVESAYAALSSMNNLPGDSGNNVKYEALKDWALEVVQLSELIGRREIAWSQIGELFGRSGVDPEDGIWPVKAVRKFIENHGNSRFREAVRRGEFNHRGVRIGPTENHSEASALKFDEWAAKLQKWPKTQNILRDIAANDRRWAQDALSDKLNHEVRSGLR